MPKKLIFLSLAFLLATAIMIMAMPGERQQAVPLTDGQSVQVPSTRAACTMARNDGTAASYFPSIDDGVGFYTYFDPALECAGSPAYPFEITGLTYYLYDFAGVGTATVDIVVYDMAASGLRCDGPGAELCRTTITVTTFYPTGVTTLFPTPCCVNGPFFMGVEYPNVPVPGSEPSVLMDAAPADTCMDWMRYTDGNFYEFYDFWAAPVAGDPLFWVSGETQSANCGTVCTWQPGDPHKMHYPQLPDEAGWDVNATQPMVLADDFQCTWTGPIKDIHFWGSWKHGIEGQIVSFFLSLHEDIPADQNPDGYSKPGTTLWEREVTDFTATPNDPPTAEGWYDPMTGETIFDDHQAYFQYDICFNDPNDWFYQDSGKIYWLNISAIVADPTATTWGWKSTLNHWNDDAVWATWGNLSWIDIWEPAQPLEDGFTIQVDPTGLFLSGGSQSAFGNGWYFYPPDEWWNIWFYDHPFAPERRKTGFIDFDLIPTVAGQPSYFEIAVNWSTDLWSLEQPPADSAPPLPGVDEAAFIGRTSLFAGEVTQGHYTLPFEILDYNPEWVSVDVRGYNYSIPGGFIQHLCQGSLDLAFVITGKDEQPVDSGACCFDPTGLGINAACLYTTQTYCEQTLLGVYEGNGTQCTAQEACCLPNGDCIMADPLCCTNELGGTPQGVGSQCTQTQACCMPDGSCAMLDPLCCVDQGGTPQGAGSQCTQTEACCMPDGSCSMLDPLCCVDQGGTPQGAGTQCTQPVACCLPDGSCTMVDRLCCDEIGGTVSPYAAACQGDNNQNGTDDACEPPIGACCLPDNTCALLTAADCNQANGRYLGDGTKCLGDNNQNGTDDACDRPWQPGDPHKMHYPQLPNPEGWDVWDPTVMADDWMCTESGPVKDIHFWGSWRDGLAGTITSFEFRIYSDIPAVQSPTGYSIPGEPLWTFVTDNFNPVEIIGPPEGWYEPQTGIINPANHTSYIQYDIYIPEQYWFMQEEGTIYWLAIVAIVEEPSFRWGWKSTLDHFNDDAVWGIEPFPVLPDQWRELFEPPDLQISLDLAFVITGGGTTCDCFPGDANYDLTIDIGDAVYLINYIFKSGPAPMPYPLCSGDANCDCTIDIGDAVYLINYIFKSGPAPCDCLTWLSICGPPLRK